MSVLEFNEICDERDKYKKQVQSLEQENARLREMLDKVLSEYVDLMYDSALEYGGRYSVDEDELYKNAKSLISAIREEKGK